MDTKFTYIDRYKIYKKDIWRMNFVFEAIREETKKAKEKNQDYVIIGDTKIALEGIEALEKTWDVVVILEERIQAASRLLSVTLPTDVHRLDLDADTRVKRIKEEKEWRAQEAKRAKKEKK